MSLTYKRKFNEPTRRRSIGRQAVIVTCVAMIALVACERGPSAAEHLQLAAKARERGELRAAVVEFKNALQKEPENADARLGLGRTYIALGDGKSARKEIERALSFGRTGDDIDLALIRALILEGEFEEVLRRVDRPLPSWDPAEVRVLAGTAKVALGRVDEAESDFRQAIELDPTNGEAFRGLAAVAVSRGDIDAARRHLRSAVNLAPDQFEIWLLVARVERAYGEPDEAIVGYRAALERNPAASVARLELAEVLAEVGKSDEAEAELDAAGSSLAKGNPRASYIRAIVEERRGDASAAQAHLADALAAQPDFAQALYMKSVLHYRAGQYAQAQDLARRFISLAPRNVDGRRLLAGALTELGEFGEAIEELEETARLVPGDVAVQGQLGGVLVRGGRLAEAVRVFEEAARKAPSDAGLQTNAAIGYLVAGDSSRAVTTLRAVLDLDREFQPARYMLISTHLDRAEFAEALAAAIEMRDSEPTSPLPLLYIGDAYLGSGDGVQARAAYESAIAVQADFAPAAVRLAKLDLVEGNQAAAMERFEALLARDTVDVLSARDATGFLGNLDLQNGDAESARVRAQALLDRFPDDWFAYTLLAELAARDGRLGDGVAYLERAHRAHPRVLRPLLMLSAYQRERGTFREAISSAEGALEIAPGSEEALSLLALAQESGGELNQAVSTYQRLAENAPGSVPVRVRLASVALRTGDVRVARRALDEILEENPEHRRARLLLGELELGDGHPARSLEIARALAAGGANSVPVNVLEGDALMALGRPGEAAEAYRRAYESRPEGSLVTKVYEALSAAGETAQAQAVLDAHLETDPTDSSALTAIALEHIQAGRPGLAADFYRRAVEVEPANVLALNNLAWLTYESGDAASAVDYARRAYELADEDGAIVDTYGWLLTETGRAEEGITVLRKAVALAPDVPAIRYHLASALASTGSIDEAVRELDVLMSSDQAFDERAQAMLLYQQLKAP